jgi:uncharacterized protein DUF4339
MTLYITKNGQQLGPYSLAEAQSLVTAGTLQATDWAWYEGLTAWIPLHQVPGFVSATVSPDAPVPRAERPVLVWVISLFYFVCTPFSLLSLALIPFMASGTIPVQDAQRHYFESLGYFDYAISIIAVFVNIAGAVLLFMLRRAAFYVFAGSFAVGLLMTIYNIIAKNWIEAIGIPGLIGAFVGFGINIAVVLYIWHLFRKGVLR